MIVMIPRHLCIAALLAACLPAAAIAAVSAGEPAALLVFPLIRVDATSGTDSLVQLTNIDDTAVAVRCVYENPSGTAATFTPFLIRLTADQPVAWLASRGLAAVGVDGGSIPAVNAFTGVLRCVAADADGKPSDRNVLVGSATVERFVATPSPTVDSARYNATGIAAIAGVSNGDDQLVLGGSAAEYDACPAVVILPSFLDGAVLDLGADGTLQRTLSTTLALVTCAQNPVAGAMASLDLSLTNEFGQAFVATSSLREQLVVPLSQLDTQNPAQSIFSVGMQGSLTGIIRITPRASGSGVLAVALQAYADPTNGPRSQTAALSPQLDGARTDPDVVDLAVPTAAAPTGTPSPTWTVTASATQSAVPSGTPTAHPICAGDCNGDGTVTINELILGVNIALGSQPLAVCHSLDTSGDGQVAINELIVAVNHALSGC
jgi:hypothetical protein